MKTRRQMRADESNDNLPINIKEFRVTIERIVLNLTLFNYIILY